MSTQPEAIRLAEILEREYSGCHQNENDFLEMDAAAELRRLHEENERLKSAMAAELEACAKLCDEAAANYYPGMREAAIGARHCATVIRARAGDTA